MERWQEGVVEELSPSDTVFILRGLSIAMTTHLFCSLFEYGLPGQCKLLLLLNGISKSVGAI